MDIKNQWYLTAIMVIVINTTTIPERLKHFFPNIFHHSEVSVFWNIKIISRFEINNNGWSKKKREFGDRDKIYNALSLWKWQGGSEWWVDNIDWCQKEWEKKRI